MAKVYDKGLENTDREIWREVPGDYYSPSIFVTAQNEIGINVGGTVFVMNVRYWHGLAERNIDNAKTINCKTE